MPLVLANFGTTEGERLLSATSETHDNKEQHQDGSAYFFPSHNGRLPEENLSGAKQKHGFYIRISLDYSQFT